MGRGEQKKCLVRSCQELNASLRVTAFNAWTERRYVFAYIFDLKRQPRLKIETLALQILAQPGLKGILVDVQR